MTEPIVDGADEAAGSDRPDRSDRNAQAGRAGTAILQAVLATVPGVALLVVGLAQARDGGPVRVPWLVAGAVLAALSWTLLAWRWHRARSVDDGPAAESLVGDGPLRRGPRDGSRATMRDGQAEPRPVGAAGRGVPHPRVSARLAGGRSREFVPPPLGGPGLSPDVDTRVLPTVGTSVSGGAARSATSGPDRPPVWDGSPLDATRGPAAPPLVLRAEPVPDPSRVPGEVLPGGAPLGEVLGATPAPARAASPGATAVPDPALDAARAPAFEPAPEPATSDEAMTPPPWPVAAASGAVVFPSLAPVARPAPAPTVPAGPAVVELSDGRVVELEGLVLVGRNPPALPGGNVLRVDDPARSVSKTHLLLGADEDGLWVVDRGSTNGTLVTLPDGQQIVCLPDRRVRLSAGSVVRFGASGFRVRRTGEPSA